MKDIEMNLFKVIWTNDANKVYWNDCKCYRMFFAPDIEKAKDIAFSIVGNTDFSLIKICNMCDIENAINSMQLNILFLLR